MPTKSLSTIEKTRSMLEDDGDDLDTNKTMPLDGLVFFLHFNPDLPFYFSVTIIFGGVDVFFFIMVVGRRGTNDLRLVTLTGLVP